MDPTPTVDEVEQPAADDEGADPIDVVLQVAVIGVGKAERDLRMGARKGDLAGLVPDEKMLEARLVRPCDEPVERDARAGDDLARLTPG
jgi:hypothetical protein